jgi:hypothetical protein
MADLVLSVDVTSLADARKKLDGFQKAMNGLSVNQLASGVANLQGKIKQLVEAQAKGNIGASAYNKGLLQLKRAYEQLGYSSQQATAAVRQYAAQLQRQRAAQEAARAAEELARAQAQAAARTRELRLRFQEGYAAFDRARKQMRDLREAMRQGVITTDQYKEAVRRLREEQQRANAAAGGLGRNVNRTGVITQQAGYQIGDFIVQVQSGTNAFVAFGQQATQVAGTLTLLGGKWILIGSVLGVAIPLLTALGAAYMRTNGAGQTLDQTLSKLKESFSELSENMGMVDDVELNVRFGNLTTEIRNLARAMIELNAASELANLTNALDAIENQTKAKWWEQLLNAAISPLPLVGGTGVNETNEQAFDRLGLPMSRQDFVGESGFLTRMQEAAAGGDRMGVVRTFQEMVGLIRQAEGGLAGVSQEGRKLVVEMYQASLATAETNALLNGSAEAAREAREQAELETRIREAQNEVFRERVDLFTEAQQTVNETIDSLSRQIVAQERIIRFGKDSELVAKRTTEAILEEEAARLRAAGATEEEIDRVIELKKELIEVTEEAESLESAISNINKISMGSVIAQVANLASVLNITTEAAMALAGVLPAALTRERAIAQAGTSGGRGSAGMPIPGQFGLQSTAYPNAGQIAQDLLDKEAGKDKGPDEIERLQQEIAFRQRTLNLSKEEKALQTEIFRITNALGKDRNKYSSDFIANLAQQNLAIQEQERVIEDARKQQEQLADSIANSFGDAFMSIVDGTKSTKDAFKQMAAAIVRDLYQVYVMKRLIGSAEAGTGIAGAIGRLIGLESGGTMTANRPYIVGERGPELVIPGRSSTVTNADLTRKSMGGSDAVNVVNNINVTGGTDPAAIRQEVAKLMPTITNATKSAVIDARRRGGQMKAAFG